jgi:hypothetical protein
MTIGIAILGAGIFAKEGTDSAEEANVPYTDNWQNISLQFKRSRLSP